MSITGLQSTSGITINKERKINPIVDNSLKKHLSDDKLNDREKNYLMREAMGIKDKFESISSINIDDSSAQEERE